MALLSPVINKVVIKELCIVVLLVFILRLKSTRAAQMPPALFLLGDSIIDVGNNNHLISLVRADFPHNGVDFPTHKATGRFSNGKNAADFIAEKIGLPSSPPYLSLTNMKSSNFTSGVSFASGGAKILGGDDDVYHKSLSMNQQVEYYGTVQGEIVQQMGQERANEMLSRSIFGIVIGSNDILHYFGSSNSTQTKKGSPQQFVASMVSTFSGQLKKIYDLGARKFVMIGIPVVGCAPSERIKNKNESCNDAANFWASRYNQGLLLVLQQYKSELKGFLYSYLNTYDALLNLIEKPATYGFKEGKAACCGLGDLNANIPCLPIASLCSNRSEHVFWDFHHPTEAAVRTIVDVAFDGPKQYVFPINIRELVSL